jgi:hypothetical protein
MPGRTRRWNGSCRLPCRDEPCFFGLARFGPTTPTRATTSLAASVDPTDARCAWLEGIASVAAPVR